MEITLRKYQLSDINHFKSWSCDPQVLRYSGLRHWIHQNSSKEDIQRYFTQVVVIPHPWYRAICLNGQPIGFISIEPSGADNQHRGRAVISCALGRDYWDRGIGAIALRKAVMAAFSELPHLKRIEASANPNNKPSQRLLEKAGFIKEGVLRNYFTDRNGEVVDQIMYSILPTNLTDAKL